jgi:hypothetical protein
MRHTTRFIQAFLPLSLWLAIPAPHTLAQTVQPAIVEYEGRGEGKFAITNNTADPMTVILEPRSFSIDQTGRGTFRALDPGIDVQLSVTSVRLQPLETYWVFYNAHSEVYPAWFTIYSTFIPARKGASLEVRFQLPHTVYLYQKQPIQQSDLDVTIASYSPARHKLVCDLTNTGISLARVQQVQLAGLHGAHADLAGFPMLPAAHRRIEIDWAGDTAPSNLQIRFAHFTLKPAIALDTSDGSSAPSPWD